MTSVAVGQGTIGKLLMQQRSALYAYIFACLRDHTATEDVLQNVAMAAIESCGQLQDEAGFLPWAREIARRRVLAYQRVGRREQPIDPELAARLAEAADRVDQDRPVPTHRDALLSCLDRLDARSRQLLALRYDSTLGDADAIARQLGKSVQSVYAQVKRLKAILRECVEKHLAAEVSA